MRIFNGPAGDGKQFYRMAKDEKQPESADIYLYDVIGDSWDGTTAKQFASDLKALGSVKTLNIFINSPGGSVFDGVAIHNQLVRHKAHKVVTIDGMAASIASVVAMAGDDIRMPKNAMMMIHNAWAAAILMGEAKDFREQGNDIADRLERITASINQTYQDRTGLDAKKIATMMNDETWMGGEEAVALGFADAVIDATVEAAAMSKHDLSKFKNIPKSLAEFKARPPESGQPTPEAGTAPAPHPAITRAAAHLLKLGLSQGQP